MNFYYFLLLIILNVSCFYCSPYNLNYITKREKYCGKRLTDMLFIVCQGKFYSPRHKRSANNNLNFDNDYPSESSPEYDFFSVYPFLQKDLNSIMPSKVRKSPGVVNECCYNPCTVETMREYCDI